MATIDLSKVVIPIQCRHAELSLLSSADDEPSKPNSYLIDLALDVISCARRVDLNDVCRRMSGPPYYPNVWPGEHYKLLAGFVMVLKPNIVLEIGTAQGLSALTMKKFLPRGAKLVTFDIIPWSKFANTCLVASDFDDRFVQSIDDLSDTQGAMKNRNLLEAADLIFIDAAKDGVMEYKFMENLRRISLKPNLITIFDDIRLWNMLAFWRNLTMPKIELTSFGHWSGTGVVQWQ